MGDNINVDGDLMKRYIESMIKENNYAELIKRGADKIRELPS